MTPQPNPKTPHPDDRTASVADHTAHFAENRANWDDRAAFHEASGYGIVELLASPDAVTREASQDAERLALEREEEALAYANRQFQAA